MRAPRFSAVRLLHGRAFGSGQNHSPFPPAAVASRGALGRFAVWFHHLAAALVMSLSRADDSTTAFIPRRCKAPVPVKREAFHFTLISFSLFKIPSLDVKQKKNKNPGLGCKQCKACPPKGDRSL